MSKHIGEDGGPWDGHHHIETYDAKDKKEFLEVLSYALQSNFDTKIILPLGTEITITGMIKVNARFSELENIRAILHNKRLFDPHKEEHKRLKLRIGKPERIVNRFKKTHSNLWK